MIYFDRYHPNGKFAPLHDSHFYRKYDIVGLLQQYEKDHPDKRGIHDQVQAAIKWELNEMAWLGVVNETPPKRMSPN